ncbi:YwqH-like family protein [Salirhabdus sp. Marseille-P4669]|uniref:YwqH-like family protein n=1 Tax=Salirhabdus sp. Marseille-P4669 TaxID=2042310 RepID=UPI000C7B91BC|nr:DUF5082 family protein [Salirhabdus sp. Marseille-P4669]
MSDYLINSLYEDISDLRRRIRNNEEDIIRLNQAKSEITNEEAELATQKNKVHDPALHVDTWAGKYADQFETIRDSIDSTIASAMLDKSEAFISRIETEVSRLQELNENYRDTISDKYALIANLRDTD